MKRYGFAALGAVAILGITASCSRGADSDKAAEAEISEFAVHQVIKSAGQNYMVVADGDTVYLDLYTTVQWPEDFGHADIKPLCDSLLSYCYGDTAHLDVNDAIHAFLKDTSFFEESVGEGEIVPIDSIPEIDGERVHTYFSNVSAQVMELTEEYATYQVTNASYLGGAHPYTATRPFTYDLAGARVLSIDDILTPAGVDSIMPVIRVALARQLEVEENQLDRAGIFTSQFTAPGQPYILGNVLYFHYNPYEIASYAAGMIDVAVYPYEVEQWLKPEVKEFFEN